MFSKILIANRGEIACRIIRTARRLGIKTVAVYSDADAGALHVKLADEAVHIGPSPAAQSYLQMDRIIATAQDTNAQAIHPGYGFLSENPEFADKIAAAGLVFIGPSADAIRKMGLKDEAKRLMEDAGVRVVPGYHGTEQSSDFLSSQADKIGYPVLIKARAGGGGKGMRLVEDRKDFETALASAQREGKASFDDAHVLIEKFIQSPRHIEIQIFGDKHGNVVHLFERDCSMQRRHQKVIEEAPAPNMPDDVRKAMTDAAVRAAQKISYHGAGTIEFIVDGSGPLRTDGFWFMEMNTRLQVEHPVTEAVTGQDLVEWQLRVADGEILPLQQEEITLTGHALEVRIYAEDPTQDFKPAPGVLTRIHFEPSVRVDTGVVSGDEISPYYDPMIAKVVTHSDTRNGAIHKMITGIESSFCAGTSTNSGFLMRLVSDENFKSEILDTGLIERNLANLTKVADPDVFVHMVAAVIGSDIDLSIPRLGWQLWQTAPVHQTVLYMGEPTTINMTQQDEGQFAVTSNSGSTIFSKVYKTQNTLSACEGTKTHSAMFVREGNVVHVKSGNDVYIFEIPDPLNVVTNTAHNNDDVLSPMTGTISIVHTREGAKVVKGDPLLVVEAMKMEHVLTAPRDGTIKHVYCNQSDAVPEGAVLIELDDVTP
jgi:3-methylcrotonyl-CoA carboxylase alpha subunit